MALAQHLQEPTGASAETPPSEQRLLLAPGAMLGSYRVERHIASGSMGDVYAVEHVNLRQRYALKVLREHLTSDREAVQRFFGEARAASRLRHPGLVTVHDLVDDGERVYFVMEFLDGETLTEVAHHEPLSLALIKTLVHDLGLALQALHDRGIIHRDIKPDNVFVCRREGSLSIKLLDLGVAKLRREADSHDGVEHGEGTLVGTPAYMSPEQVAGQACGHQADLYTFGVLLFEALTGRLPFQGASFGDFMLAHLTALPSPPSELRRSLAGTGIDELLAQMLAKSPDQRIGSAQAIVDAFAALNLPDQDEGGAPEFSLEAVAEPAQAPVLERAVSATAKARPSPDLVPSQRPATIWGGLLVVGLGALLVWWNADAPARSAAAISTSTPVQATPPDVVSSLEADVVLTLESNPPGATVIDLASGLSWGVTPLERISRPGRILELKMQLEGYAPTVRQVDTSEARRLAVTLLPLPAAAPVARTSRPESKARTMRPPPAPARTAPSARPSAALPRPSAALPRPASKPPDEDLAASSEATDSVATEAHREDAVLNPFE